MFEERQNLFSIMSACRQAINPKKLQAKHSIFKSPVHGSVFTPRGSGMDEELKQVRLQQMREAYETLYAVYPFGKEYLS